MCNYQFWTTVATVVSAVFIVKYTFYTKKLVAETKKQREQSIRPFLIFKLRETRLGGIITIDSITYPDGCDLFSYRIVNIGSGPAIIENFEAKKFQPLETNKLGSIFTSNPVYDNIIGPSIDPELEICFSTQPKNGNKNALQDEDTHLIVEYRDIFGQKFSTEFKNRKNNFKKIGY